MTMQHPTQPKKRKQANKTLTTPWRTAQRAAKLALLGLAAAVLVACGGGGGGAGGAGTTGDSNALLSPAITVPDIQTNVTKAVLQSGVKVVDQELAEPDANGNFSTKVIDEYKVGQVIVFNKIAYKITALQPVQGDGTAKIVTTPASLEETFADLKMQVVMHPVSYDENGKFQQTSQTGLVAYVKNAFQTGLAALGVSKPSCFMPGIAIKKGEDEYGQVIDMNCSLADLLGDGSGSWADVINFKGSIEFAGRTAHVIDVQNGDQYIESIENNTLNVIASLNPIGAENSKAFISKLDDYCAKTRATANLKYGKVLCKVEVEGGGFKVSVAGPVLNKTWLAPAGPVAIPVFVTAGVIFEFTINASGQVHLKGSYVINYIDGIRNHQPVNEKNPVINPLEFPELKVNGEADMFLGLYTAGGGGINENYNAASFMGSFGIYGQGVGEFGLATPLCVQWDAGHRGNLEVNLLKIGALFDGFKLFDYSASFPSEKYAGEFPRGCVAPSGTIGIKYFINGKDFINFDGSASGPSSDVYSIMHQLVDDKEISIDLTNTRKIYKKGLAFEIDVLDSANGVANLPGKSYLTNPSKEGRYLAVVHTGDTSYGDEIKLRIRAFVPNDRAKTEVTRDLTIKVEPQLSAQPEFFYNINTGGNESYRVHFNYSQYMELANLKAGHILFDNGKIIELQKSIFGDRSWESVYGHWINCVSCVRSKPTKLFLYSTAEKTGDGQVFPFTEVTAARVDAVTVTPLSSNVGDKLTVEVTGRLLNKNIEVEIPNCSSIIEVRTQENIKANNWPTDERKFTCTATGEGVDLIAKVKDFPLGGFAKYTIKPISSLGTINTDSSVLGQVRLWITNAWTTIKQVAWSFSDSVATYTANVVNGVSEEITHTFTTSGTKTVTATYKDASGNTLGTGKLDVTVAVGTVTTTATITAVQNDNVSPVTAIPNNTSTTDTTPKITGTISAALGTGDAVRVYAGTTLLGTATTTGTNWVLTGGTALAAGTHTLKAVVYNAYSMNEGSNTNSWTITVTGSATIPSKLPHSGITASQCYSAGSNTLMACSGVANDLNAQQDGHRVSVNPMTYSLVPNVSGIAGLNYSKNECVKDNVTGLIWEGKTADNSFRDYRKTYTNFDSTTSNQYWNGSAFVPPTQAQIDASTNAKGYVNAVNAAWLCGKNDWRLPTVDELQSIVDYSKPYPGPTVNSDWFINTKSSGYWASTPYVGDSPSAWYVLFNGGYVGGSYGRYGINHVRLVRASQ